MFDGPRGGTHREWHRGAETLLLLALLIGCLVTAGVAVGAAADEPTGAAPLDGSLGDASAETDGANATRGGNARVTLVTGHTVAVTEERRGTRYRLAGNGTANVTRSEAGTYVYPSGVNRSKVDPALFNVDLLHSQNVTDARTDSLPVIVLWEEPSTSAQRSRTLEQADLAVRRDLEMIDAVAVDVEKADAAATYQTLAESPAVASLAYDGDVRASAVDPGRATGARTARARTGRSGDGVTVAVVDSGVNESHPALRGTEVGERDVTDQGTTADLHNHGTAVAGIVAGDGPASTGVAPNASILDVRTLDEAGIGKTAWVVDGIEHAIEQDADVIALSLGFRYPTVRESEPFERVADRARAADVPLVVAAGNGGGSRSIVAPGSLREAITVGASDTDGGVWDASRRGPTPDGTRVKPDLVAPGVDVRGPDADGVGYRTANGTSYAVPQVAGAAALLREAHPTWSDQRLKSVLTATADPLASGAVYAQGAGELNVTAALGADVTVEPATVDVGTVTAGTTATETVTVRNSGSTRRQLDVAASASAINASATGTVSVNRSSVTLAPNGTATVALTVDTETDPTGTYSGRLTVGDHTVIFGYVVDARVTVEKRGFPSPSGDRVRLYNADTGTVYETDGLTGSTVTVDVAERGEYVALSAAESEGQAVVVVNRSTAPRIVLDRAETVRRTVDTDSVSETGDHLRNRTVTVNVTVAGRALDTRVRVDDAETAAIRVSPTAGVTYATRRVLTTAPPEGEAFDAAAVYHLHHVASDVEHDAVRAVDPAALAEQRVSYYRGSPGETYSTTLEAPGFDDIGPPRSYTEGGIGTRHAQTIYVSPSIAQYHDAFRVGDRGFYTWSATARSYVQEFAGGQTRQAAIKKHPFRSALADWSLTEDRLEATVFPTVGQPPNGYILRDSPAETYEIWLDGQRVETTTRNRAEVRLSGSGSDISSARVRVRDGHDVSPLSNDTVTTFAATTDSSDARPPVVPAVEFGTHGPTNVVGNGSLDLTVSTRDAAGTVENVTLYVATRDEDGIPATTPFQNATGWRRVPVAPHGDGTYESSLDLGDYRGTLSVGVRAVDGAGNYVETTARDAVVVGSRRPTANLTANRTLVTPGETVRLDATQSYDDLGISNYTWDVDGDGTAEATTVDATLTHRYAETGTVAPTVTVTDAHGRTATADATEIAVARTVPPRAAAAGEEIRADLKRAIAGDRTDVATGRLNGGAAVPAAGTLVLRGDVNGGLDGGDGSTAAVVDGRVNGRTTGHNLLAADARFNGGIDVDGAVAVTRGTVTATGGVEAAETVRVLPNSTLTVRGRLSAATVVVERNGTLRAAGDLDVGELIAGDAATVRVRGHGDCSESNLAGDATVSVRGGDDCPEMVDRSPPPRETARDTTDVPTETTNGADDTPAQPDARTPTGTSGTDSTGVHSITETEAPEATETATSQRPAATATTEARTVAQTPASTTATPESATTTDAGMTPASHNGTDADRESSERPTPSTSTRQSEP